MPRTALQYKQIKDERKLSILEASLPLFALYENKVSIDLISEKAKCSHGLVYHYFNNTDDVLEALLKSSTYQDICDDLFKINHDVDAIDTIKEIVKKLTNVDGVVKASYFKLIISDDGKKSLRQELTKLIKLGQEEGNVTGGNPSDIIDVFFLFLKGIYLTYLTKKKADVNVPSIDNIMEIFNKKR